MRAVQDPEQVSNHWWWRPGWRTGRHFYACHVTFENEPKVQDLAAAYQESIKDAEGLDLIPRPWLHLTMQGIGFTDEVSENEIGAITADISVRLADVEPPIVTFGRPVVRSEAIYMPASPADAIDNIRRNVHEAITEILGPERTPDIDIADALQHYVPHVSIAYANSDGLASPYIEGTSPDLARPCYCENSYSIGFDVPS